MSKLVLITGAPGSGKTTLAKLLADKLGFKFVDSDDFLEVVWQQKKHDPDYDRSTQGLELLLGHIKSELAEKRNVVTEITLIEGKHEKVLEALFRTCDISWLHCSAEDPLRRFQRRETNDGQRLPEWFPEFFKDLTNDIHKILHPLKIGHEPVIVNTEDGYQPSLDDLATGI